MKLLKEGNHWSLFENDGSLSAEMSYNQRLSALVDILDKGNRPDGPWIIELARPRIRVNKYKILLSVRRNFLSW